MLEQEGTLALLLFLLLLLFITIVACQFLSTC